jgi:hypothetical protein
MELSGAQRVELYRSGHPLVAAKDLQETNTWDN